MADRTQRVARFRIVMAQTFLLLPTAILPGGFQPGVRPEETIGDLTDDQSARHMPH
jgi:hypothetical protein